MVHRLTGKKAIGLKQTIKCIKSGQGKTVYIACDADEELIQQVKSLAEEHVVEIKYVDTMKELGKLCGIDVGASAALILND